MSRLSCLAASRPADCGIHRFRPGRITLWCTVRLTPLHAGIGGWNVLSPVSRFVWPGKIRQTSPSPRRTFSGSPRRYWWRSRRRRPPLRSSIAACSLGVARLRFQVLKHFETVQSGASTSATHRGSESWKGREVANADPGKSSATFLDYCRNSHGFSGAVQAQISTFPVSCRCAFHCHHQSSSLVPNYVVWQLPWSEQARVCFFSTLTDLLIQWHHTHPRITWCMSNLYWEQRREISQCGETSKLYT